MSSDIRMNSAQELKNSFLPASGTSVAASQSLGCAFGISRSTGRTARTSFGILICCGPACNGSVSAITLIKDIPRPNQRRRKENKLVDKKQYIRKSSPTASLSMLLAVAILSFSWDSPGRSRPDECRSSWNSNFSPSGSSINQADQEAFGRLRGVSVLIIHLACWVPSHIGKTSSCPRRLPRPD
jgi:hypothetical protein